MGRKRALAVLSLKHRLALIAPSNSAVTDAATPRIRILDGLELAASLPYHEFNRVALREGAWLQ